MQKRAPIKSEFSPAVKRKAIHKTKIRDKFVVLPNSLAQDKTLSLRSRGLLLLMLSMPNDWQTHQSWIETQCPEGREAIRASIRELMATGYVTRRKISGERGKMAGYEWTWHSVALPIGSRSPSDGFPSDGNPADGKPAATKNPSQKVPTQQRTETKESKETPPFGAAALSVFPAQWKPDERSKAEKLATLRVPSDYPSERSFDAFLEASGLDNILTYRPDLYSDLCDCKWHQWRENTSKWAPIRDWQKYVQALDESIGDAMR